jgi:tRNA 2-thiouridine synthesizing protein E
MSYEVAGRSVEADANGYLINQEDWDEQVAEAVAAADGITLTPDHWDVLNYLREEYFQNSQHQPNMRALLKGMGEVWSDRKVDSKALYDLFPMGPHKQAAKVAGLPETKGKAGY